MVSGALLVEHTGGAQEGLLHFLHYTQGKCWRMLLYCFGFQTTRKFLPWWCLNEQPVWSCLCVQSLALTVPICYASCLFLWKMNSCELQLSLLQGKGELAQLLPCAWGHLELPWCDLTAQSSQQLSQLCQLLSHCSRRRFFVPSKQCL